MKTFQAAFSVLALAAALTALPAMAQAAPGLPSTNVAWVPAASDADVDRAFAQARAQNKPVLLYWGATWCPPCNQLKATLFNRADFAAQSKSFVAVHVDGDRPGAQKLGQRFKVTGYPTVVLFKPDGSEITRLPGEADAPQVMAVLQQGLSGGRAAQAVLADALGGKVLSPNDWRVLAFYSWETSEAQLVPKGDVAGTLVQLAASSAKTADPETHTRLWLKAVAASDASQGVKPDAALRARVLKVLADPAQARAQMDVLSNSADDIVRTLTPEGEPVADRARLLTAFDSALLRLEADATLSRADRLGALLARVELARIEEPSTAVKVTVPAPLQQAVRAHIGRADREIRDGYERQAVITAAAYAYGRAGLWDDSNALLQANLAKSHSPYYLMSQLGGNARKLGDNPKALDWYAQSYAKSEGPATRLQWGSGYLSALVDLAPKDAPRIEQTMSQLLKDAAGDAAAFEGRSARSLQRAADKLKAWNAKAEHAPVMKRLQTQLDGVCAQVDAASGQRATCQALLKASGPEA